MARLTHAVLAGVLVAALGGACARSSFVCELASDCQGEGQAGTCEATGWCSFPDSRCESGSRYGEHSGDGLAGACVPSGETTSSAGSETTATSTTATTVSTLDGTSTPPETSSSDDTRGSSSSGSADPFCGDGIVDGDEACDDANRVDGDGCSDCVPSGSVIWSQTFGEAESWGHTLDGFATGSLAVGLVAASASGVVTPQVWRITSAGDPEWIWDAVPMGWDGYSTWGLDVATVDGEERVVVAVQGFDGSGDLGVTALLDDKGDAIWSDQQPQVTYFGAYLQPTGDVIVVGQAADGGGVTLEYGAGGGAPVTTIGEPFVPDDGFGFDVVADGDAVYTAGVRSMGGTQTAFLNAAAGSISQVTEFELADYNEGLALALDPSSARRWVVGYADDLGGFVATVTAEGIELPATIVTDVFSANLHGVAIDPSGAAIVVGWDSAAGTRDSFVAKVTPEGERVWMASFVTGAGDDDLRDVVVGSDGAITVAGTRLDEGGLPKAWVARLVP